MLITVPMFIKMGFSPGEARVCEKLMTGASNKTIGQQLYIDEKTVKFHSTNIFRKAGVKSRTQFVIRIYEYLEELRSQTLPQKELPIEPIVETGQILPQSNFKGTAL